MKRSPAILVALTFALLAPLAAMLTTAQKSVAADKTEADKVVTDADNGSEVTVKPGDVLVVRLKETPSTGYSRAVVTFPDTPLQLVSTKLLPPDPAKFGEPVLTGAPQNREWKFKVDDSEETTYARAMWLKFLSLRPFDKGVDTRGLWEVKVTIPAKTTK